MKYPNEFLGRCQTCLDNAYLSSRPCTIGYGNGMPLSDSQCSVRSAQAQYDAKRKRRVVDSSLMAEKS